MKNSHLIFILAFLLLNFVFYSHIVFAQDLTSSLDEKVSGLQEGVEKISNVNPDDSSAYLKQEWTKILEKNNIGSKLLIISNFIKTYFNWFFKLVLGVEYSLSWAFIFSILTWFGLFFFMLNPFSTFLKSKSIGIVLSLIVSCLIGFAGAIRLFVNLVSSFVNNVWLVWISLIVLIVLVILADKFGIFLALSIIKDRKEYEKLQEKLDRESLHIITKTLRKI